MESALGMLLEDQWGLVDAVVTPLEGGMNSRTWTVRTPSGRYVAKWVPTHSTDLLAAGGLAARLAARSGVRTGVPVPARDGADLVPLTGGGLVLLEHVDGTGLEGETDEDAAVMGRVLAAVHRETVDHHADGSLSWHWVVPDRLPDQDLRAVAIGVVREVEALDGLVTGLCHGDPAPAAFLVAGNEQSLIDWGSVVDGPLLYDVASAVMYLGGPTYAAPLLTAYEASGGPAAADLAHVETLLRMRWVVQADYFAARLASDDLTGVADRAENRSGYDRARRALLVDLA